MRAWRWRAMALLAAAVALAQDAAAQPVPPRIGYVYPAGGRQGTSFQITVGGRSLDGVTLAHLSGTGIKATIIEHVKPLTPAQATSLRDKLKDLMDKRLASMRPLPRAGTRPATRPVWTPDDEKQVAEIRKKLASFVRRPSSPAIAEMVTIQIVIAADAECGQRDLRLSTAGGLTNAMVFCVGTLPELIEAEAKASAAPTEVPVVLPALINGQIMPGDVDRYRFKAVKGQKIVAAVSARALIPYLADAVPGWFQATLGIYDAKGVELAYADDWRFNPDPVLYYEIPRDGEYYAEVKDSIYRGREDFVYRIALGELPFVTGVFPLGGKAGGRVEVELKGWNLPVSKYFMDGAGKAAGLWPLFGRGDTRFLNNFTFALDTLPEVVEREPNDAGNPQMVVLPAIINGRIDKSGDWDVFRFEGRAGDRIVADVQARRLGSPLDSIVRLTDPAGKQLAINDDHEDKGAGLTTHHADSHLSATLPSSGVYAIHLGDTQQKGGSEYAYRLRISSPRPDFSLRVTPATLNLRPGVTTPITIFAMRRDGFAEDIVLSLKNAPAGFTLAGARIPGKQDQVRLTLTAPGTPPKEPIELMMEGRATLGAREVVRQAVPAEDMMQAFAYRHLVPAHEWKVGFAGRWAPRTALHVLSPTPVKVAAGSVSRMLVAAPAGPFVGDVQLQLSEPPDGISIRSSSRIREGIEIVLAADGVKAKVGLRGNLIVEAFSERTQPPGKGAPAGAAGVRRRFSMGVLPAVPFEVTAR